MDLENLISMAEVNRAADSEQICFPPNEACTEIMVKQGIAMPPGLFLIAVDRQTGKIAAFLNGLSTEEFSFRDEFFTNFNICYFEWGCFATAPYLY